jgi:DNA-binding MarR family transcriptional regulator
VGNGERVADLLSDYMWRYLRFIAANEPHCFKAGDICRALEEDHGFLFWQLKKAEQAGLAHRHRDEVSGPWLWELTSLGRKTLAERSAG